MIPKIPFLCTGVGTKSEGHWENGVYVYGCPEKTIANDGPYKGKWVIPNIKFMIGSKTNHEWYSEKGYYQTNKEMSSFIDIEKEEEPINTKPVAVFVFLAIVGIILFVARKEL